MLFTMDGHPESHKDDSSGTQVYTLGEIVVTRKKEGVESIGTVHRVTQEDISISGARNLNEAVNLLPGINVMVGGDAVPKIDIRGFRPRHNILLLNGIPINSTYDQQFNPSIIPVENIAEIKLTSGPSSVLYGQGGLGGVINIITKRGGEGISGMVGAQVGAGLSHLVKGSVSGRKGRMDYFTSASYSSRDAYPLSAVFEPAALEDGAKRNNSDKEAGSLFANLGYDPSSVLRLGLTFSYLFGEYGIPPNVHDPETDIFAAKPKYRRIEPYQGYSIQGAFELFPEASPLSLRGWLYFNQMGENSNRYSDDQYDDFIRDRSLVTYRLKNETRVLGITLQPQYAIGDTGILTMGLTAQRDMWKSQGTAWNIWSSTWPPGYTP
ncbi:MAG: TonB-dependent receptor plug domain-containing protein, partial [Desulfatitalea sp.]|nr:TonB-dependent receptor plug domain-containing protein [Desulfatitalea sp.]NNK00773.1 TonB-dependent receptor plug domain-containing protein [Desulfatitalea sp.]